ncbi:MAG TPA: hypothetical protein VKQ72_15305, partial [Aggregatilineales bacterium]|nr:hypothetical protein [Aggregatilineales bacterium]
DGGGTPSMADIDLSKYGDALDDYEDIDVEEADETYLGEATLAKLRGGEVSFTEDEVPPPAPAPKPEGRKKTTKE